MFQVRASRQKGLCQQVKDLSAADITSCAYWQKHVKRF